jgi:hypothetical protein
VVKVILYQLDGKVPNIALMRIAAHHRALGDDIELRWQGTGRRELFDSGDELVYASLIFEKTRMAASDLRRYWPNAIIGGTGWAVASSLETCGITTRRQDYTIYQKCRQSIGFTQRGCRLKCSFCVVPRKEGAVTEEQTIAELWRGDPWPRELILLDNDFFGQPNWRDRIAEIRGGRFKVSFNQGINARFLTDEAAEAIASIDYRDDSMKVRRIYTAWDNKRDEERLMAGLERLRYWGVKPDHIMVYVLVGYDHALKCARSNITPDDLYRVEQLRKFGARPYPMPFVRNAQTVGFQRWIVGAYDKRFSWDRWEASRYRPENLMSV